MYVQNCHKVLEKKIWQPGRKPLRIRNTQLKRKVSQKSKRMQSLKSRNNDYELTYVLLLFLPCLVTTDIMLCVYVCVCACSLWWLRN